MVAMLFSVVDISNCYWDQKRTEESSFLCVFNSPFGRYRFKRMPFGISCASEVTQKMVENILAIFQVHYQFSIILSLEVEMNKNMI